MKALIPIEASWEEAATGCRGQEGFRFCQMRPVGTVSLVVITVYWRAIVIPIVRERRVYNRCAIKVTDTTKKV